VPTRHLADRDWADLRELRLTALRESPAAFLSTYALESTWTDDDWQREAARGDWLVETVGDRPVGLLGATPEWDIAESDRYLSYLWVAPDHRRRGVGQRLVRTMLARLRANGVERAWLWVLDGNEPARRLYERLGFTSTGERQPLKEDPARCEERMTLALR
jgi:ribosomal protein S18 acetylase RimI-like enzyme